MRLFFQENPEFLTKNELDRRAEKKKIRKASNLIGIVLIILWFLPYILSVGLVDLTKIIFGYSAAKEMLSDPAYNLFLQTLLSIAMFTAPFLIIPLRTGKKRAELISFKKPEKRFFAPLVLFGVGMSAFANIATSAVSSFFAEFGIEFLSPKFDYPTGFFGILISVLAIAVTPALVEEFSMRGMVMGHLRQQGDGFAIVVSAILFAMIHGNFVQIPFAFIMGLVIGYVVVKSGSIITGIAVHFINNFASLVLDIVSDNIDSVMLKSAITVIYLAACILCGFIGLRLAKKHGEHIWELDKPDTVLSHGEKLGYFITAPAMIVAMGAFVAEALQMVHLS